MMRSRIMIQQQLPSKHPFISQFSFESIVFGRLYVPSIVHSMTQEKMCDGSFGRNRCFLLSGTDPRILQRIADKAARTVICCILEYHC